MNESNVFFIFPNISRSAENSETIISRVESYAKRYLAAEGNEKSKAMILASGINSTNFAANQEMDRFTLRVFSTRKANSFRFLIESYRFLKSEGREKTTLVSGDNYSALLFCIILKRILPGKIRIQISVHGNPLKPGNFSLRNVVRKACFSLLVHQASSVRIVSRHLEPELRRYFHSRAEVFVSPIPVTLPPLKESRIKNNNVGIVGRLHSERGINQVFEIIQTCARIQQDVEFTVLGDGPERVKLERLNLEYPAFNLQLLGSLPHEQTLQSYQEFSLLLSCAPTEGYGLALREAIMCGVPVVARSNPGTRELQRDFPEMVFLFDSAEEAVRLIKDKLDIQPNLETVQTYRQKQVDLDNAYLNSLIKSWT